MNEIKTIGIIGNGKMGSDIFNYLSDFNFDLIWFTRNSDHKKILRNTYHKKIKRQLKHGIISQEVFDIRFKYRITTELSALSGCDLIIESIIEDIDAKVDLFTRLDEITKSSCVLASNSSSILPSELSENISRKNRIIGLHFFYPIAFKNIVEIIVSDYTDEITVEKTRLFLDDIKRFYIEQNENNAFILNRLLLQVQITAFNILKEKKIGFQQFDDIAKKYITDFGLFEMMDHVGHNTMYNAIMNYSRWDSDKRKYEPLLNELKSCHGISTINNNNLFYNSESELVEVSKDLEDEIFNSLKVTTENYLNKYSDDFQINIYSLKKALNEYCGIML